MTAFDPKIYQQQVLESVEAYFHACHEYDSPAPAFTAITQKLCGQGNPYQPLRGDFSADTPYFCLRVPTGGGKTWLAAKSVALINTHWLRSEHSVILWLVPSDSIREQTLKALKNRHHPYHAALRDAGEVTVLDLQEAQSVTRATLDTSTTVIVATRQAFQVSNTEHYKVYQSNGALMQHFAHLTAAQRTRLLHEGEGENRTTPCSLANVLRLRRPFVIVDEAHNSRTTLAFDMLARLNPSGILELTATPDMERTPSNVLHSVSAAELKAEEMIKLPVLLQTEPNWQQCLADAIARRESLQALADSERRAGAPYLRPIVLIQAEARRSGLATLEVETVHQALQRNHGIAADNKVAERSNDLTGIAVEEDQACGRNVQRQSEQCRNEKQGGEDRQVKCLHVVDCRHHDKQCNRNIQTDKNVKQNRRQRNNHHDDDCHDSNGDQNITVSLYEITGCKGIYTASLRCCHALITPSFPSGGRTDSSFPSILYQILQVRQTLIKTFVME